MSLAAQPSTLSSAEGGGARLRWAMLTLLVLALALQIVGFRDLRHDDAYITYRYAENIARGDGPVFNPGQRLLGTTAPGHMLLAAAVHRLVGHAALPTWMAIVGCIAWSAQAVAAYTLLREALGRAAAAGVAGVVLAGGAGQGSWVALETNLVAALVLGAIVAGHRARWGLAGLAAGAAAVTRPDAIVIAGLLSIACLVEARDRRALFRFAAAGSAVAMPWLIFAVVYYGSVVPNTAAAKIGVSSVSLWAGHVLSHPFGRFVGGSSLLAVLAGWALAISGAVVLLRRDRRLWVLPAYGLSHLLAYLPLRSFIEHQWHLFPVSLVAAILGGVAASTLATTGRPLMRFAGTSLVAALIAAGAAGTLAFAVSHADSYWWGGRDCTYRSIATFLSRQAAPGDLVASVEVGTLAYWGDLRMWDLGGLVNSPRQFLAGRQWVRWLVADPLYQSFANGARPFALFSCGEFSAGVWSRELPDPEGLP